MEKMTKTQKYEAIKAILVNVDAPAELIELCDHECELIAAKAEKAAARAAEKKAEGDELRETVHNLLTNEYQTAQDLTDAIANEEVTRNKVIARLTQLVNAGIAEKADAKTEDGKNVKVYKLAE